VDKAVVHVTLILTIALGFWASHAKTMKATFSRAAIGTVIISVIYFALLMFAHSMVLPKVT
jgi:hypothetical protein